MRRIIWIIMIGCLLCGCTKNYMSSETNAEMVSLGQPMIEEYLDSLDVSYEIEEISMMTGAQEGNGIYAGYYPSKVVVSEVKIEDQFYFVYADTESQQLWTDYNMLDVNEQLALDLKMYLSKYGYDGDIVVRNASVSYYVVSHDIEVEKKGLMNTYVTIEDALPIDGVFENIPIDGFNIYYEGSSNLNPNFLVDYLNDTQNYVSDTSYWIYGMSTDEEITWYTEVTLDTDVNDMKYDSDHRSIFEQDNILITYIDQYKSGRVRDFELDEVVDMTCPVFINGNTLTYEEIENGNTHLYFKEKPDFESVTCNDGKEEIELSVFELENGMYSIRRNGWKGAYVFSKSQTITWNE